MLSFDTAFKKGAQDYTLKSLCRREGYGVVQELYILSSRDRDVIFQMSQPNVVSKQKCVETRGAE